MTTSEERSDKRFYDHTIAALKDIEERALQLPLEQRYGAAYGILRGYFEALLTNFAEAFSEQQLAEIRIVLDQLSKVTGEDTHLDEATRAKLDQLAQALRESEQQEQRFRAIQAGAIWRVIDTEWRTTMDPMHPMHGQPETVDLFGRKEDAEAKADELNRTRGHAAD